LGSLRRVALMTLVLCLFAMAVASTAIAAPGHALAGSVSTSVTGGLAVNQTSGAVYVADSTGISEIGAGTATPFVNGGTWGGLAVDNTSGTVYAVDTSTSPARTVSRFDSAGAPLPPPDGSGVTAGYFNPSAIAVDPDTSDVYVANVNPETSSANLVEVFDDTGAFQTELTGDTVPFSSISGLAVDGSSRLLVLDGGNVNRYSAAGVFDATIVGDSSAGAVAADPASDEVYTATSLPQIINYDPAGAVLFRFGAGQLFSGSAVAVVGSSNRVYVADPTGGVVSFFDAVTAPDVTTGTGTPTATTADLTGTVDPLGQSTTYQFEWGTSSAYGNVTDPVDAGSGTGSVDAGSGTGSVDAAASLTGLLPNTEYHYRLVATGLVANFGDDATFKPI
jgi:hypothetical protein